jgi:hypothetical protein
MIGSLFDECHPPPAAADQTRFGFSGDGVLDLLADARPLEYSFLAGGPFAMNCFELDGEDLDRAVALRMEGALEGVPAADLEIVVHIGRSAPS